MYITSGGSARRFPLADEVNIGVNETGEIEAGEDDFLSPRSLHLTLSASALLREDPGDEVDMRTWKLGNPAGGDRDAEGDDDDGMGMELAAFACDACAIASARFDAEFTSGR